MNVNQISESEFQKICADIIRDREIIYKHNPIGTEEETLLWMLMSVLITYLSIKEDETPCFNGMPDSNTYRNAIKFVLRNRKRDEFDEEAYIERLLTK